MKRFTFSVLLIFLVNSTVYTAKEQGKIETYSFRSVTNNAFSIGEKLTYKLHYGFINAGEARLEVKGCSKKIKGRELLHVVGTGRSISAFDWFFKVRDRYESYLDAKSVFPWLFIRRVNEGGITFNQDYTFYQHKQKVSDGEKQFSVPHNIQDMISSYYYARTLDFQNAKRGDIFEFNTLVDGEVYPLKIKYLGKENIKTKKGEFRCLKFCPVVQTGRIFKKEEDLIVWISDDKNKIPLLAKAKIIFGSVKMEIIDFDGLRNPTSKL